MKVLFIHNSLPEYRIEFWRMLSSYCDLDLYILDSKLEKKIYNFEFNSDGLDIISEINFKKFNYDLVVMPPVDTIDNFRFSYRLKKYLINNKIPYIYWTEKWIYSGKIPLIKKMKNDVQSILIKNIAKDAKCCIAAGTKQKEYLISLGIDKNLIFTAIDSSTSPKIESSHEDLQMMLDLNESDKVILYLGRLIKRKGIYNLIQAYEIVKNKNKCLIIAGDGDEKEKLIAYVKRNNIKRVFFLGKIEPEKRRYLYERANVFILPSIIENGVIEAWGLTVNESLECGTPVIASDIVGASYDLLDGKNGDQYHYSDYKTLANKIDSFLVQDKDRLEFICKNSYKNFSVDKMAVSFKNIFEYCMKNDTFFL